MFVLLFGIFLLFSFDESMAVLNIQDVDILSADLMPAYFFNLNQPHVNRQRNNDFVAKNLSCDGVCNAFNVMQFHR